MDDASLWDRAMHNTLDRLEVGQAPLRPDEPTSLLRDDGLATSLLLVDVFWDMLLDAEALVAAPVSPNKLVVAPRPDRRSLKLLRQMMERDPLSVDWRRFRGLLVRRQGRWEILR